MKRAKFDTTTNASTFIVRKSIWAAVINKQVIMDPRVYISSFIFLLNFN